jgi:hypothetical protein
MSGRAVCDLCGRECEQAWYGLSASRKLLLQDDETLHDLRLCMWCGPALEGTITRAVHQTRATGLPPWLERACHTCGAQLDRRRYRAGAIYCSAACRQRAYRQRVRDRSVTDAHARFAVTESSQSDETPERDGSVTSAQACDDVTHPSLGRATA